MLLIYNYFSGSSYRVVLGANRYDGTEIGSLTVLSSITIVHPRYNPITINNDIAVIQLPSAVPYTSEYCRMLMCINLILFIIKQTICFLFTAQTFICFTHLCC